MDERWTQEALAVAGRIQTGMVEIDAKLREPWWKPYLVDVPPGRVGKAEVRRFTVTEMGAFVHNLREANHGRRRGIPVGEFTELRVDGRLWMSDTPAELGDMDAFRVAVRPGSRVLLHGLGLGCTVLMAFRCGAVRVTVIELDADVLALVGPHWKARYGDALDLRLGDAHTWRPGRGERWNVVWHDIWPDISGDHVPEMRRLRRRFARRADWQGVWCEREMRREARRAARDEADYKRLVGILGGRL